MRNSIRNQSKTILKSYEPGKEKDEINSVRSSAQMSKIVSS